ncbi:hypothetical protein PILCRDRAFT_89849 [Piloderma croceum F 1598]|uniref:Uncharacterized protein n=1 Tax=Piloderma croceum (strain F 1598) TaxID=765440 RepID=A0A0C3FKD9_PILCF|nr:hypothetical protein PILCRDRAFT_89849 [Piloderma croceum F 1598]
MELVDAQADLACVTAQNEGLQRKAHASFMRGYRALGRLHRDAEKSQTQFFKEKGVITDSSQEMTGELVAECSMPVTRVNKVIRTVARGFGITLKDTVDKHSVSHILLEGELASEIQLVSEMHNAGNLTISGDGTTNKHINLKLKHGLMVTPTYASDPDAPTMNTIPSQQFFSINTAIDHKSETQLQGWKDLIDHHAEDQKKLVHLFKSWKDSCKREMRGEEAILLASLSDLICLIWEETERNISNASGLTGWQVLSADE